MIKLLYSSIIFLKVIQVLHGTIIPAGRTGEIKRPRFLIKTFAKLFTIENDCEKKKLAKKIINYFKFLENYW